MILLQPSFNLVSQTMDLVVLNQRLFWDMTKKKRNLNLLSSSSVMLAVTSTVCNTFVSRAFLKFFKKIKRKSLGLPCMPWTKPSADGRNKDKKQRSYQDLHFQVKHSNIRSVLYNLKLFFISMLSVVLVTKAFRFF